MSLLPPELGSVPSIPPLPSGSGRGQKGEERVGVWGSWSYESQKRPMGNLSALRRQTQDARKLVTWMSLSVDFHRWEFHQKLRKRKSKGLLAISEGESCSVVSDSLRPHELGPARFLCPWNSPGKNTGVGSHCLLQGIFPTQRSNPGLLHSRPILYHLSHQRSHWE